MDAVGLVPGPMHGVDVAQTLLKGYPEGYAAASGPREHAPLVPRLVGDGALIMGPKMIVPSCTAQSCQVKCTVHTSALNKAAYGKMSNMDLTGMKQYN